MGLEKGFLRPHGIFNKKRVLTGVLLGLNFSYLMYGILVMMREAFRIFAFEYHEYILPLSPKEITFYNYFYAFLSTILGTSISLKYIFENSINRISGKIRRLQMRILNDLGVLRWPFMLWFFKVSSIFALVSIWFPLYYHIDMLKDFWYFFILIIIYLFFGLWPGILRPIHRAGFSLFYFSMGAITINSLLMAQIDVINSEDVDSYFKENSIDYNFRIEIPISDHGEFVRRRSRTIELFCGFPKDKKSTQPTLIINRFQEIELNDLVEFVNTEKNKLNELERDRMNVMLHMDSEVPLVFLDKIESKLYELGIQKIQYSTVPHISQTPNKYMFYRLMGLNKPLFPSCSQLTNWVDSIKTSKAKPVIVDISAIGSFCSRVVDLREKNRIVIGMDNNSSTINSVKIDSMTLASTIRLFIKKYKYRGIILLDKSNIRSYGQYIDLRNRILDQVYILRYEFTSRRFNKNYGNLDYWSPGGRDLLDFVNQIYPKHIVELSDEEKYFYEFLKENEHTIKKPVNWY